MSEDVLSHAEGGVEKHTVFSDMCSGGSRQHDFDYGWIEGDEATATKRFIERYGDPAHVTCTCCGQDYSVTEFDSLEELLQYYPKAIKLEYNV